MKNADGDRCAFEYTFYTRLPTNCLHTPHTGGVSDLRAYRAAVEGGANGFRELPREGMGGEVCGFLPHTFSSGRG